MKCNKCGNDYEECSLCSGQYNHQQCLNDQKCKCETNPVPILSVTVYDGKYTVILPANGGLKALRHGKEWRDLCGDGLVLALAQEVDKLRETNETLTTQIALLGGVINSKYGKTAATSERPIYMYKKLTREGVTAHMTLDKGLAFHHDRETIEMILKPKETPSD